MPVKRKSRGRSKGGKGRSGYVQCNMCGQLVPRDKDKKVSRRVSVIDPRIAKELRQKGAYLPSRQETKHIAFHARFTVVWSKCALKTEENTVLGEDDLNTYDYGASGAVYKVP